LINVKSSIVGTAIRCCRQPVIDLRRHEALAQLGDGTRATRVSDAHFGAVVQAALKQRLNSAETPIEGNHERQRYVRFC
jgi:hypothetical protein